MLKLNKTKLVEVNQSIQILLSLPLENSLKKALSKLEIDIENSQKNQELFPNDQEILKPIFGFPYSVSSFGRVQSNKSGRWLKSYITRNGYEMIVLRKNNTSYKFLVHRLVATAFREFIEGYDVNHIDNNKLNNHVNNLEWVTRSKNLRNRKPYKIPRKV